MAGGNLLGLCSELKSNESSHDIQAVVRTVFSLALANTAFANWWIVRSSDGHCLIVDLEPTGSGITKMGKEVYQTQEQAEADAKLLCKEPKAHVPRASRDDE